MKLLMAILVLWLPWTAIAVAADSTKRLNALQQALDSYRANLQSIKDAWPHGEMPCLWHARTPPPPECVFAIEKIAPAPVPEDWQREADIRRFQDAARATLKALEDTQDHVPIGKRPTPPSPAVDATDHARQRLQRLSEGAQD